MGILNHVKIKKLNADAIIPVKSTPHSSGYDVFSSADIIIKTKAFSLVPTGISLEMEPGLEAQIRPRSGLAAKNGITVLNAPGTIDSDYRGEIKVILINHSDTDFTIKKGDRIAQMVFAAVYSVELKEAFELNSTIRGDGGFGSTGV
jgi:dUTP pyrophosphatase